MKLATLANNFLQIDVDATACGQAGIEGGGGFAASFTNLVGFKRAFDHVGYRAVLATSKPMSQVACFALRTESCGSAMSNSLSEGYRPMRACHQDGR